MRNLGVGKLFHSPKITQVGSEEARGEIFSFLEQVVPYLLAGYHLWETQGWKVLGRTARGGNGSGRGGDWTDGGADVVGGVCGRQKPLSCSELARPLSLSLCLSFLTCKQDSKRLKATPRPLISWYPGLWM